MRINSPSFGTNVCLTVAATIAIFCGLTQAGWSAPPNVVLIVIDDLGYGDLGCYGNTVHATPTIDSLAATGMRFTDFHSNGPVCSPTRAALMTGCYQQRSGVEHAIGFTRDEGVPLSATTIAEALHAVGYASGVFGKWHLGHVDLFGPNSQGFQESWCSNNTPDYHSHISREGASDWYHNHKASDEPGYLTDLVTDHTCQFIREHKGQPFFSFVSHVACHFPFQAPGDPAFREAGRTYHGNERKPGQVQVDSKYGPLPPEQYKRAYREMLAAVDASVGKIIATLEELNLRQQTLIFITSDNGAYSWVGSNEPLSGEKGSLREGGHRIPAIANWPGHVPEGTVSHATTMTMDLFPTLLKLANIPVADELHLDGVDISNVLLANQSIDNRTLFWRFGESRAVRRGPWKLLADAQSTKLFNLNDDLGEHADVADGHGAMATELLEALALWEVDVAPQANPVPPATNMDPADPISNPLSKLMLDLPTVGTNPGKINYQKLPHIPAQHAIISDVRDRDGNWVHQHAYVAFHNGRYWAMWSDGPGGRHEHVAPGEHRNVVPHHDQADTRISYATSKDGLNWSKPADLSGPPKGKGYGWIARGLWDRDGELLALASPFIAPSYAGPGLSLEAFRWDDAQGKWLPHGTVRDDSMNNFPPKKLPSGEYMMTRRDSQRQVSVMVGGVKSFDDWRIRPMASYDGNGRPEEPYWYVLPDGKNIVGLIRDNGRSGRLLRTFSTDNGHTWTPIVTTNFPDATSKFFVHRTSRGYYAMVSNSNPRQRDPLTLAISKDGLVFTHLFYLIGGRHIDYPHIMEHDDHLLVAFSGAKQTMEVMKISLDDIDRLMESADSEK